MQSRTLGNGGKISIARELSQSAFGETFTTNHSKLWSLVLFWAEPGHHKCVKNYKYKKQTKKIFSTHVNTCQGKKKKLRCSKLLSCTGVDRRLGFLFFREAKFFDIFLFFLSLQSLREQSDWQCLKVAPTMWLQMWQPLCQLSRQCKVQPMEGRFEEGRLSVPRAFPMAVEVILISLIVNSAARNLFLSFN